MNINYFLENYPKLFEDSNSVYLNYLNNIPNRDLKKEKGYEIHHVVPKIYFKNRNLVVDNSQFNLIKLTAEEHIKAHYLLAKNNEEFMSAFYAVINFKINSIENFENINIDDDLRDFLIFREACQRKSVEKSLITKQKEGWSDYFKQRMQEECKNHPERLVKSGLALKEWKDSLPPEELEKFEVKRLQKLRSEEARLKSSISHKNPANHCRRPQN